MAITFNEDKVKFEEIIYEDEVVVFRDYLLEKAGIELTFDFKDCDDIHFAIIQLIMAYKKEYDITYEFGEDKKLFQTVLEGFNSSENNCN